MSDQLLVQLSKKAADNEEFDSKEILNNYTTDTFSNCGFGVEAHALDDPNSTIKSVVKTLTGGGGEMPFYRRMATMMTFFAPKLANLFKMSILDDDSMEFFANMIRQSIAMRYLMSVHFYSD